MESKIAKLVLEEAAKSLCSKRKVGAVIVDDKGEVIAKGHNYNPKGKDCEDEFGNTYPEVIHAEIDAIENALTVRLILEGYTIYISHPPCDNCKKAIKDNGMTYKVVEDFMKWDKDKLKYNLVPPFALKELAKVLTYGAKKYKPNNWRKINNPDRYIDALYRHLEAWRAGEEIDKESGLLHLSHALTNIVFLLELKYNN